MSGSSRSGSGSSKPKKAKSKAVVKAAAAASAVVAVDEKGEPIAGSGGGGAPALASAALPAALSGVSADARALRDRMNRAYTRGEPAEAKEETRLFRLTAAAAAPSSLLTTIGAALILIGAAIVWRDTLFVWPTFTDVGKAVLAIGCFVVAGLPAIQSYSNAMSSCSGEGDDGDDEEDALKKRYAFRVFGTEMAKDLEAANAVINKAFKPIPNDKALTALIQTADDARAIKRAGADDGADSDDDPLDTARTGVNGQGKTKSNKNGKTTKTEAKPQAKEQDKASADASAKAGGDAKSGDTAKSKSSKAKGESEKQRVKRVAKEIEAARTAKEKRVVAQITEQLNAGMSLRRIQQSRNPKAFVLKFDGDMAASGEVALAEQVTLCLAVASPFDMVVVLLTSPGGLVHSYGLAAAQLERIRHANLTLTVCVDSMAASGGYLMAGVANTIVAAPFAWIGSIGVVMGIPNVAKVLKRNDVEYYEFTAGKYKRTVEPFTEPTPEGKAKTQESLNDIHRAFKAVIARYRPELDLERVATGEAWLGSECVALGLVDVVMTSDEYLRTLQRTHTVITVTKSKKKESAWWMQLFKLFSLAASAATARLTGWLAGAAVAGPSKSEMIAAAAILRGAPSAVSSAAAATMGGGSSGLAANAALHHSTSAPVALASGSVDHALARD